MVVELYFSINYLTIILIVTLSSIDKPLYKLKSWQFHWLQMFLYNLI